MEWHHRNRIKASMAYIERILVDIEEWLDGKKTIYENVENDLNEEQIKIVRKELKQMYKVLEEAKKEFDLWEKGFTLSHIMEFDSSYIWETIDDLWSKKLEKGSGKIDSEKEKEKLDTILQKLKEGADRLMDIARSKDKR